MRSRLFWYRAALYLYPKAYRHHYGDQMAQTVADMLADQPDRRSKVVVWLRISIELPFSITQEHITNLGENGMRKLASTNNKRLTIGSAMVLVILLALILPSFIRTSAIPGLVKIKHRAETIQTLRDQENAMGNPFSELYNSSSDEVYVCSLAGAQGIKTAVECQATMMSYAELPQDTAGRQKVLTAVKTIEEQLKNTGWNAGDNGVTLSSLVAGTYEGKDYSPDAAYQKTVGNYQCLFDTNIAYSNPKPAAINSRLNCSRIVNVFGAPGNPYRMGTAF